MCGFDIFCLQSKSVWLVFIVTFVLEKRFQKSLKLILQRKRIQQFNTNPFEYLYCDFFPLGVKQQHNTQLHDNIGKQGHEFQLQTLNTECAVLFKEIPFCTRYVIPFCAGVVCIIIVFFSYSLSCDGAAKCARQ